MRMRTSWEYVHITICSHICTACCICRDGNQVQKVANANSLYYVSMWHRQNNMRGQSHFLPCTLLSLLHTPSSCLMFNCLLRQESSVARWMIKKATTDSAESAHFWYMPPIFHPFQEARGGGERDCNALQMAAVWTTSLTCWGEEERGRRQGRFQGNETGISTTADTQGFSTCGSIQQSVDTVKWCKNTGREFMNVTVRLCMMNVTYVR